jgi:hypothetical protein
VHSRESVNPSQCQSDKKRSIGPERTMQHEKIPCPRACISAVTAHEHSKNGTWHSKLSHARAKVARRSLIAEC